MGKDIKISIHNRFYFVRRDAETGKVLEEYKAENIILNGFWANFLSTSGMDCLKYIHFGSGVAQPIASDIKLNTWIAQKTSVSAGIDYSKLFVDGTVAIKKTIRLEDTEFNGNFISEVGFSSATSGTTGLLTKALVKDMNGNVVSIEKKAGEILDIYATFYTNVSALMVSPFSLLASSGSGYPAKSRLFRILTFQESFPAVLGGAWLQNKPQNTGESAIGFSTPGILDVANKKVTCGIPNLISTNGNIVGGIRGMSVGGLSVNLPCVSFAQPVLVKEVVGTGDGLNKDFQTKFGYVLDNGTAKVYVNDAEVSATIDYNKLYPKTDLSPDMVILERRQFNDDGTPCAGAVVGSSAYEGSDGAWVIFENPWYETIPIESISIGSSEMFVSNDLVNWISVGSVSSQSDSTKIIPVEYRNYRYWKHVGISSYSPRIVAITSSVAGTVKNIHLASAPAIGSTVAVTYQPDCIAKDTDHVLNNVSVVITFNEYTPT